VSERSITPIYAATLALVEGVFALVELNRDDLAYYGKAREVLELCRSALLAAKATLHMAGPSSNAAPREKRAPTPLDAGELCAPVVDDPKPAKAVAAQATTSSRTAESGAALGPLIAELHSAGKGVREIGRALGVSPSTVSRRLRGVWRAVDRG
jgi:hypothetical protein